MSKAILTDITKCIGCLECVSACKAVNDLDMETPKNILINSLNPSSQRLFEAN